MNNKNLNIYKEKDMRSFIERISSRKFLMMMSAFLASLGTSISGLVTANSTITTVGIVCTVLSSAIYSAIEATVDRSDKDAN